MDTVSRFAEIKAFGGNEEVLLDGVGIFSASLNTNLTKIIQ